MRPQITKYLNGNIEKIEYISDDLNYHREDGPAVQYFYINGKIYYEMWYINGNKHRTNGPAYQEYETNGIIIIKAYYINGKLHRTNGPAYQSFYVDGKIKYESWLNNGIRHRTDGPSVMRYFADNGEIYELKYNINDIELTEKEFIIHNRKRKLEIINGTYNN